MSGPAEWCLAETQTTRHSIDEEDKKKLSKKKTKQYSTLYLKPQVIQKYKLFPMRSHFVRMCLDEKKRTTTPTNFCILCVSKP